MKKIAFIIPYFGHFNNYFNLWLNSCANNPTVDWIIFTDCQDVYNYPDNVKIVYMTFDKLKMHIQSLFNFEISLNEPYKLCDYRPAFGDIFYEYIKNYDFWGYCDTDLIWGNVRSFITDDILSKYDKIGNRGHCCLLRNSEEIRKAYRYDSSCIVTYRDAFSSDLAYCFDENKAFGRYCQENNVKTCDNFTFFDVDYRHDDYRVPVYEKNIFKINAHNIFEYDNGRLFLWSVEVNNEDVIKKEILYVHLQKRKMNVGIDINSYNQFLIYRDNFAQIIPINARTIKSLDPKSWKNKLYLNILWKKIKAEIFHCGGVKYYKYDY